LTFKKNTENKKTADKINKLNPKTEAFQPPDQSKNQQDKKR
jgi:hypothetical protein